MKNAAPPLNSKAQTTGKRRVYIVDDHPLFRHGMVRLIDQEPDLTVCGEAGFVSDAFSQVQKLRPDLLLTDLILRTGSGLELIKNIKAIMPRLVILVFSMHDDMLYAERVLRAGAMGYVSKNEAGTYLLTAIRRVLDGEMFVSDTVKNRVVNRLVGMGAQKAAFAMDTLSDRELEVFRAIGNGLSTRQVAEELCLSVKTIETYREHLKSKLNINDSSSLVRHAIHWMRAEMIA